MKITIEHSDNLVSNINNDGYLSDNFAVANDLPFNFEGYGEIIIPRGTPTSDKLNGVRNFGKNYVTSFDWCKDYPEVKEYLLKNPLNLKVYYLTHPSNLKKLNDMVELYSKIEAPRIGDYVLRSDGYYQIAYDTLKRHGDPTNLQLRSHTSDKGYFYLYENGGEASGCMGDVIPINSIKLTEEIKPSHCWFFDLTGRTTSQKFTIDMRVYKELV